MDLDTLTLSPFAFIVAFQIVCAGFATGLASFLVVLVGLWRSTRNPSFRILYRFWGKIFAVSFGMTVLSGVALAYELMGGGPGATALPTSPEWLTHIALTAYLTTALVVGAASAWRILRRGPDEEPCMGLRMAIGLIAVVAPLQLFADDPSGSLALHARPGLVAIAFGLWGGWLLWRTRGPEYSRAFLWSAVALAPAAVVAAIVGAASPTAGGPVSGAGLAVMAAYALIAAIGLIYILRLIAAGHDSPPLEGAA